MIALCIVVAGALQTVIPTTSFTLAWTHSIEKVRWEERYLISPAGFDLQEARIKGSGAGMEPPPDAVLAHGWWQYRPALPALRRLQLANSRYADDYTLCWEFNCELMNTLIGFQLTQGVTEIFPCQASVIP